MPDQDEGLGGLRDVARALNADEEWEWKMAEARAELRKSTEEIYRHAETLAESVQELVGGTVTRIDAKACAEKLLDEFDTKLEPMAEVALTEDELRGVIELFPDERMYSVSPEQLSARDKLSQALAVESGAGGKFVDPA